jgi:CheY-like chemotaxis protein
MSGDFDLPCPACGQVTRVSEDRLPPGGEIPCAACGEAISFRTAPETPVRATPPGPFRATGPRSPLTFKPIPETSVASPAPGQRDVTCPACGHHFDLRETSARGRRSVLVVEDTEFFLELATQALGRRYSVIPARTAAEARQVLATRQVDLVVLDLNLPDSDGAGVLRSLPRSDIPVLVYTSRDETQLLGAEWDALCALGARDVVHKGMNIEDLLLRKVDALIGIGPAGS